MPRQQAAARHAERPSPGRFTLEYWKDGRWYVGRLREVPGVFSQGATLDELEENIRDAYREMMAAAADGEAHPGARTRAIRLEVA